MTIITPTMPTPGSPRGGEETDLQNAVQALLTDYAGNVDENNLKDALCAVLGVSRGSTVRRGRLITAAAQNMPVDTLGSLPTPDRVTGIVLPADGLILVSYYARFQYAQSGATGIGAGVALDINGQVQGASTGVMGTLEGQTPSMGGTLTPGATRAGEAIMSANGPGLTQGAEGSVLSGSLPSAGLRIGGLVAFELAAGTYNVEAKWRRFSAVTSAGTVQDRRLRVVVLGF